MPCNEAIKQWRHWLSRTLVPLDVQVHDADSFTAQWRCRDLGQLQFVEMEASAQCVTHGTGSFRRGGAGTFQLVYSRRGTFATDIGKGRFGVRSEEHTSELQSLMRISYAVFCLKTKKKTTYKPTN